MESLIYPMLQKKRTGMQERAITVFKKHRDAQIPENNQFLRDAVTPKDIHQVSASTCKL